MTIINAFDAESDAIIDPSQTVERIEGFPETVISAFSEKFTNLLASTFDLEEISFMVGGRRIPIYSFEYKGRVLGFYQTLLGGSATAALLEEVIAKGGKNILFFGSCGSLDKASTFGKLIVPTHAWRDEGTSYHYAPASDFIEVKTAERLSAILERLGIAHKKTRTWTTDSIYRETANNMEDRKKRGCSVVEMECASLMAVGQFRNVNVYQFLYTTDSLDGNGWNKNGYRKIRRIFRYV